MRWKVYKKPEIGDTRWVKRFFFFPMKFHDTWIWLEVGQVRQKYVESYIYDFGFAIPNHRWETVALINI